jgi:hypothetical protein
MSNQISCEHRNSIRLPLAPKVEPNETVSSWIDRCAARHFMTREELITNVCFAGTLDVPALLLDWDVDPNERLLAHLENAARLSPGSLYDLRVAPNALNLAPSARLAFCPLCASEAYESGQLPSFNRDWVSALTTRCRTHDTPLFAWDGPTSAVSAHTGRAYPCPLLQKSELADAASSARWRGVLPDGSDQGRSHHMKTALDVRALGPGLQECSWRVQEVWRRQCAMEDSFSLASVGDSLTGPAELLGTGAELTALIEDLFSLALGELRSRAQWYAPGFADLASKQDLAAAGLWRHLERATEGWRDDPQHLTSRCYEPDVRRAALHVVHIWLDQLATYAAAHRVEIDSRGNQREIGYVLSTVYRVRQAYFKTRVDRWPLPVRQICRNLLVRVPFFY